MLYFVKTLEITNNLYCMNTRRLLSILPLAAALLVMLATMLIVLVIALRVKNGGAL